MIAVLAYWLLLFFLLLPAGLLVKRVAGIKSDNPSLLLILGMFFLAAGFSVTAFFFPLGWGPLLFFSIISLAIGLTNRKEMRDVLVKLKNDTSALPLFLKAVLAILITGAALKSVQFPFVIDNESYYVQTIKWLNEYGFVKGLGNLHIFFAQTSSWHVLQAGLNFSFITDRINDINGFLFIVCTAFYITESRKQPKYYWMGLLLVFSVLLFQFVDSPSPDLPLLMITPVILYLFAEDNGNKDNFRAASLLFIFLVFIKITIAPLGLLFTGHLLKSRKNLLFLTVTGTIAGLLWIAKNTIISGYPLYPLSLFRTGLDWTVPESLFNFIVNTTSDYGYYKGANVRYDSIIDKLAFWVQMGGIAGALNKLAIALFIIVPLFRKTWSDKKYFTIYLVLLLHFLFVLFTSPQFRFFLPQIMFFSVFIISEVLGYFKKDVLYKASLSVGAASVFILFFNISTTTLTSNKYHAATGGFKITHLWLPEQNSRYSDMEFVKIKLGNMGYFSPVYNFFLYGTADGPLPCLNEAQLEYFEKKLRIRPQQRGESLKEGFYSEKTLSAQ